MADDEQREDEHGKGEPGEDEHGEPDVEAEGPPAGDPNEPEPGEIAAEGDGQAAEPDDATPGGGGLDGVNPTDPEAAAVATYTPSYVFLGVVTLVNLVADLWSKAWAKDHFESLRPGDPRRVVIVEDFMNFIFAKNRGGAWGLLQNETESLRRPFFLIVSVAAIVFIVSLYRKLLPGQTALKWGLPLVLGGALGNLVDRIRYGYVVDFIDVYMQMDGKPKHWPTFNVADISICIGVALMAIDMFTSRDTAKKPQPVTSSLDTAATASVPAETSAVETDESKSKAEEAAGEGA